MHCRLVALLLLPLTTLDTPAQWAMQSVKTDADFRGLSVIDDKVVWVGGTKGTIGRTADGGKTWTFAAVPGAEKFDFRDVEAVDATTAYALSAGPGSDSRVYKTTDGGKSWSLQFQNAEKDGFYDALALWDATTGVAMSDPVKGAFRLVATTDGATWKPIEPKTLPAALANEGAFAASGTCLITHGKNDVWFATGGAKAARVFRSADRGRNWTVAELPIPAGVESAGVFSLAFRDATHGIAVGGDYKKPDALGASVAVTADGGTTWTAAATSLPFLSGAAWAKDRWVAVGTSGSFASRDGTKWERLDKEYFNAVQAKDNVIWAVGPKGRIAVLTK